MNRKGLVPVVAILIIVGILVINFGWGYSVRAQFTRPQQRVILGNEIPASDFYTEVDKANYCSVASDCAGLPSSCLFLCGGPPVNKNEVSRLEAMTASVRCVPQEAMCADFPGAPTYDPVCVGRRCTSILHQQAVKMICEDAFPSVTNFAGCFPNINYLRYGTVAAVLLGLIWFLIYKITKRRRRVSLK